MLDFKRLQFLDAVYRHHNFTRASEELFVSQSAISIAVKTLEQELGVTLVVRTPQGVTFTPEGERFMLSCKRILRECENVENEMADLSESKNLTLRLGISPTLGLRLQQFLHSKEFTQRFPNASLFLEEGSMRRHVEKLRMEALDLSFNAIPTGAEALGMEIIPVMTSEIYAIMGPSHPYANRNTIPIEILDKADIIMLDETSLVCSQVMQEMQKSGVVPNVVSSHEQVFTMINTVKFGDFIGFMAASDPYIRQYLTINGLILRHMERPILFESGFIMKSGRYLPSIGKELIEITKEIEKPDFLL
ncbi:MAG: LysR family transcriptional regulator [Oscillospiraceae bacterium]|nr:LysR family transcriptional regulator [Oscillospiraceae bacterium]